MDDLRTRIDAAWNHLGSLWPLLWPSERDTYAASLYATEIHLYHGRAEEAEARFEQTRDWVRAWALPRLRGESPPPCDPFGIGVPNTWAPPRNTRAAR